MRLCTQGCLFSIGGPKPIRHFFLTRVVRVLHTTHAKHSQGGREDVHLFGAGCARHVSSFDELSTLGHVLAGQAHEPHSVEKTSGAAVGCAHARHPQTPTAAQLLPSDAVIA